MRKVVAAFVLVLAALAAAACAASPAQESSGVPNTEESTNAPNVEESSDGPNIVLILTDDMREDELEYMPKTQNLIIDRGVEYRNAFVTTAQCCPSRSSILRGQYVHNHGVLSNGAPEGGFEKFESLGHESSTVATWLQNAGYKTALIGKYLNQYPAEGRKKHVPSGWNEWYGKSGGGSYDYVLNENGTRVPYESREQDYSTDVLAEKAKDFVRRSAGDPQPFFVYLSPSAPHDPHVGAPRHEGMFEDTQAPRPPSFNEADVSDKPEWVRDLSGTDEEAIDEAFRGRLRMLQAVDDMVEGVVNELSAAGELENTYLFFARDNGWHLGEHGIAFEKNSAYEESIGVPLAVRGPGIPPGRVTDQMALNIDLGPTFADLGGATVPSFVDGRSLRDTFAADAPSWRTAFLAEKESRRGKPVPEYEAVRTATHKYVEIKSGSDDKELYDLTVDPHELENIYDTADPVLLAGLEAKLDALRDCAEGSCQAAEDGP